MIFIVAPDNASWEGEIVRSALCRSFSVAQVCCVAAAGWQESLRQEGERIVVLVQPREEWSELIAQTFRTAGSKVIILGALPAAVASRLNVEIAPLTDNILTAASCPPAPPGAYSESELRVIYRRPLGSTFSPLTDRPFLRYDFADEWNNLGYGAIRADGSTWSLAQLAHAPTAASIADVMRDGMFVSTYAASWDFSGISLLWFNRAVGPVDSPEWRLVEAFISSYRYPLLPCLPALSEIPWGFDGAVTMRLDCDEDVYSARSLFQLYQEMTVPLSLAVTTSHLGEQKHQTLIREVLGSGGALLSHSVTHPVNWGGGYEEALREATESGYALEAIAGQRVPYAVSPFHQTPGYARAALADAGYAGCVGGVMNCDPDFIMARGGIVPGSPMGFIGHSQQCMLHGDCLLNDDDPLRIYKEAFDLAFSSRTLFGYLDHPFSTRYQYGWRDEESRSAAHRQLIAHTRSKGRVLFMNEQDTLDFVRAKSQVMVRKSPGGFRIEDRPKRMVLSLEYAGQLMPAVEEVPK